MIGGDIMYDEEKLDDFLNLVDIINEELTNQFKQWVRDSKQKTEEEREMHNLNTLKEWYMDLIKQNVAKDYKVPESWVIVKCQEDEEFEAYIKVPDEYLDNKIKLVLVDG